MSGPAAGPRGASPLVADGSSPRGARPPPPPAILVAPHTGTSFGKLVGIIAVFTLLGIPVLAYLWETLNKLIAGVFEPWRLLVSVPVLLAFVVLLWFLAPSLSRLDGIGTEG
jgi:hypothetical protein